MTTNKPSAAPGAAGSLVWERAEPVSRPALEPLSRARIVQAAMAIADAEGLTSVSLRKVGAALDAGPMRLYGYLSTKEELLELMVDAVYGEMADEPLAGDWRAAVRALARRVRQAAGRHPWFVDLLGGRPSQGPHGLAYLEALLTALHGAPGFAQIDTVMLAAGAIQAYLIGALRSEASELRAEAESGLDQQAWQIASWPYLQRMIASGRFPTIATVVREASHPPPELVFERGLECVLDGIAVQLRPAAAPDRA